MIYRLGSRKTGVFLHKNPPMHKRSQSAKNIIRHAIHYNNSFKNGYTMVAFGIKNIQRD